MSIYLHEITIFFCDFTHKITILFGATPKNMHYSNFFIPDFMHWIHFFAREIFIKCWHNNVHFYMWKNEKHAFCFRFETTKEHSNQNKKINKNKFKIKISNLILKFIQNYIWNFLISRFTPHRKRHIYGDF